MPLRSAWLAISKALYPVCPPKLKEPTCSGGIHPSPLLTNAGTVLPPAANRVINPPLAFFSVSLFLFFSKNLNTSSKDPLYTTLAPPSGSCSKTSYQVFLELKESITPLLSLQEYFLPGTPPSANFCNIPPTDFLTGNFCPIALRILSSSDTATSPLPY